jgi:hypothetical protein
VRSDPLLISVKHFLDALCFHVAYRFTLKGHGLEFSLPDSIKGNFRTHSLNCGMDVFLHDTTVQRALLVRCFIAENLCDF